MVSADVAWSSCNDSGKKVSQSLHCNLYKLSDTPLSLERLKSSAEELSKETHKECLAAQADVRKPEQLREAVKKTIERFGRIDFVVCGA